MTKWFGILIAALQCIHLYSTETVVLNDLYNRINEYDNVGAHNLVLDHARKLYALASECQDDSIRIEYRCKALLFQLDYYRNRDYATFSRIFSALEQDIFQGQQVSFGNLYGYYINQYEYLKRKNSDSDVLPILNKIELLLLKNQSQIEKSGLAFRRMMVQFRKGDAYLRQSQYSLAKSQYYQALQSAREADSLKWMAEKKYWGYEQARLVDLFKLAVVSGESESLNTLLLRFQLHQKKSLYQKLWDRELIRAVLEMDHIQTDQINRILIKLTSNDLLSGDPLIFIKISHYFLQHDDVSKSIFYKDKAALLLSLYKGIANVQLEYNLLLAAIALKNCQYEKVDSLIESSKQWLVLDASHKMKGSRQDYLTFMQQATALYSSAYQQSKDTSQLTKCAKLTDEAVKSLYYLRLDLPDETDRMQLLSQLKSFSDLALNNYYELFKYLKPDKNRLSVLLNYFESNKSFNLFLTKNLPAPERAKLSSIKLKVFDLDSQLLTAVGRTDSLIILKSTLIDSSMQIWQQWHPDFKLLDIEVVQNNLSQDQSIIEYFNFNDRFTYALVINKAQVVFDQLPLPTEDDHRSMTAQYIYLGNLINDFSNDEVEAAKEYRNVSSSIYSVLVRPLEYCLTKKILIIPESNMSNLPWGAMLTYLPGTMDCRAWPYWIKSHSISTQHSLSIWSMLKSEESTEISTFELPLIAFAPKFADLNYNTEECNTLKYMMGGAVYLDSLATKENFLNRANTAKIIHISGHAEASAEYQDSSSILFAASTLYNSDIARLSLPADLVFLSACETGIGKILKDEGVFSLARAFFSAGAKSVISTLWKVNDRVASLQVASIYSNLIHGQSKDEAIRRMQLDYIDNARTSESAFPYYWAGFQCQGDLSPLVIDSFLERTTYLLSLIPILSYSLTGLGGYLFYHRKYLAIMY